MAAAECWARGLDMADGERDRQRETNRPSSEQSKGKKLQWESQAPARDRPKQLVGDLIYCYHVKVRPLRRAS